MSNFASSKPVILKGIRAAWLDIFKPAEGMNGGAPKYKFSGIIDPDSEALSIAKTAMLEAARQLWGQNAENMLRSIPANSKAIRNGNDKVADDGSVRPEYAGKFYISASSKADKKPQVVGPRKHNGQFVTITEHARGMVAGIDVTDELGWPITVPYRGCYVNAKIEFVAGKQFKGANGEIIPNQVFARIHAIQFLRDGEPFGSGPTSAEGFDEEEVVAEATDASGNELF